MWTPFFSTRKNRASTTVPPPQDLREAKPLEVVLQYHEQTKHHPYRFARSLGYLDWDNQPDPFRRFVDAPLYRLPHLPSLDDPSYQDLYASGLISPATLSIETLSRFFRNAFAISAWKSYQGSRWSLRVNPSSGNLHPTESYAIIGQIESLTAGVYHYAPREHGLEQRAKLPDYVNNSFLVGLTSIHWREAWKYGERAYRYCQHDLGHALGALRLSAAMLGWRAVYLEELSDGEIASLLGLTRADDFHEAEDEHPECLVAITASSDFPNARDLLPGVESAEWSGRANRLSETHVEWEIIDQVAPAAQKPRTEPALFSLPDLSEQMLSPDPGSAAETIIQQRRSAVALDGQTSISRDLFLEILSRTLPDRNRIPFDLLSRSVLCRPQIHFALFVHRVEGITPGLYVLIRNPESYSKIRAAMQAQFLWTQPFSSFPLYLLEAGDFTRISSGISCGQEIAGDGVFSLGMLAEFEESIRSTGAWLYPRLFWEAGLIGQILYLEAEAAGIRATGIGCYFDDPMHELLGLQTRDLQSLYHFTMGGPVEDTRLTTDSAYDLQAND